MSTMRRLLVGGAAFLALLAAHPGAPALSAGDPPKPLEQLKSLVLAGRYVEAQEEGRRLLSEVQGREGSDSLAAARVMDVLAEAMWRYEKSDVSEAQALIERAIGIKERVLGPEDPEVVPSLFKLGNIHFYARGDAQRARSIYERALAIQERASGADHPRVGMILTTLGAILEVAGDYPGAHRLYERALKIQRKAHGPEHRDVAINLHNLAGVLSRMGRMVEARDLYKEALEIERKVLGDDHFEVGTALRNLGDVTFTLGDYDEAKRLLERSLEVRQKALGPDHSHVADSLAQLAKILVKMGRDAEARPLYERALAIQEKALGPNHRLVAWTANALALLLGRAGDTTAARALHERSLAIYTGLFGERHPETAACMMDLADLLVGASEQARAAALYDRAVGYLRETYGPDHSLASNALARLARFHWAGGRPAKALAASLESEAARRKTIRLTNSALPEREALNYASSMTSRLDVALSAVAESAGDTDTQKLWDAVVRGRALVLDEMASRNRVLGGGAHPDVRALQAELASARSRLANLLVRGGSISEDAAYVTSLAEARLQAERIEAKLAESSLEFRRQRAHRDAGMEAIAAALPADSVLVSFVFYRRLSPPDGKMPRDAHENATGVPSYVAFLLRATNRRLGMVPLGSAADIDMAVSRWTREASETDWQTARSPGEAEEAMRAAGETIRRRVWNPLLPHIGDARMVFIVPDGALHLVSFGALPDGETGYVIERAPLLHYLSAERDLVMDPSRGKGAGLLALGGPSYDGASEGVTSQASSAQASVSSDVASVAQGPFRGKRSACAEFRSLRFDSLPAAVAEAQRVAEMWKKVSSGTLRRERRGPAGGRNRSSEAIVLTGPAATEPAFKEMAPGRRILHLATHGFFLDGECPSILDGVRGIGGVAAARESLAVVAEEENPLILSGLALASANRRADAAVEDEDGILTAEEVGAMDLSGVEWAVLSACSAASGRFRPGEGLVGLRRAFQIAGARTLIMSLWPVDDEAAVQWMTSLYEARLRKRLATAEAVREASLRTLASRRRRGVSTHPSTWAGFVATGDWR